MEIKKYHVYTLQHGLHKEIKSTVVVVQNDFANEKSEDTIVVPYKDGEFEDGLCQVSKEDLIEELGKLDSAVKKALLDKHLKDLFGLK